MKVRFHAAWAGAVFALCAALTAGCGAEGDRPGFVVMPEMYDRIAYGAFDPSEVTDDGKTLILPPEGTVPYGATAFLYGPGTDEAERAGRELVQPLDPTRENLARGRQVYQASCSVCHGSGGRGDGPIIGRFPNPPSLLADRSMTLPDGHLLHVIVHGQGIMAPHGTHVRGDDRWRLVMYVRQLQGLDPAGVPPSPNGDLPVQATPTDAPSEDAPPSDAEGETEADAGEDAEGGVEPADATVPEAAPVPEAEETIEEDAP